MAMITKTMRLPPRRVSTPSTTTLNKRKESEDSYERPRPKPSIPNNPTNISTTKLLKRDKPITGSEPSTSSAKGSEPSPSNRLLAGYLAHEFLTRGTLLGQPWDPSRAAESHSEPEKKKSKLSEIEEAEPPSRRAEPEKYERYVEIADLFRVDGTHLPGIVNPTQLAGFLHVSPR